MTRATPTGMTRLHARFAFHDLRRNRGVAATLVVVLTLCAFLMATGAMVVERLARSVDALFDETKPPHFLQMHVGDYDEAALQRFAAQQSGLDAWLIEDMLGFDGAAISWSRPGTGESGDLSASLIDNLVVTQNVEFDFLVDASGAIPRPSPGEIYVPVAYEQRFGLRAGDELGIRTDDGVTTFAISGFVRDGQMASSLSSATRFLVSDADFATLGAAGGGAPEIIVEYRLTDLAGVADLQRAYTSDAALPHNGEAVTDQLIRMIHTFSDGLVAVALVLASILLITIALLSLRLVIRGSLEDEVRQIGALKALGVPDRTIGGLYLARYGVLTAVACVVGGAGSVLATDVLTRNVAVSYSDAGIGVTSIVVGVAALAIVAGIVLATCHGVLRRVRRVQVVDALVHGSMLSERASARRAVRNARRAPRSALATYGGRDVARRLALLDLRTEGGAWALVVAVFLLVAVAVALPLHLLTTMASPRFTTYLGVPESDVRADLAFSDDVDVTYASLVAAMRDDPELEDVRPFATVLYDADGAEGWETMRVQVGDHSGTPVEFLHGGQPGPGEIALSVLNADKFGVGVGDELAVRHDGESSAVVVSGVYQDITSSGYTAKMDGDVPADAAAYAVFARTADGVDPGELAAAYSERFPGASVVPMREYVRQTMAYATDGLRGAAILCAALGVGVAVLLTSLFLTLRLVRERPRMGVLSALGFSSGEIAAQTRVKTLLAVVSGTVLGLVAAATLGESLVGTGLAATGLGLVDLAFTPDPWLLHVALPAVLVAAGYGCAVALTARLRGADTSAWLKG